MFSFPVCCYRRVRTYYHSINSRAHILMCFVALCGSHGIRIHLYLAWQASGHTKHPRKPYVEKVEIESTTLTLQRWVAALASIPIKTKSSNFLEPFMENLTSYLYWLQHSTPTLPQSLANVLIIMLFQFFINLNFLYSWRVSIPLFYIESVVS